MRGVARNGDHGGAVAHQHLGVALHNGKGIGAALAQNKLGAVRRGGAAAQNQIDMVLIARSLCVLGDHLVKITAGSGAKPAQNAKHRVIDIVEIFHEESLLSRCGAKVHRYCYYRI